MGEQQKSQHRRQRSWMNFDTEEHGRVYGVYQMVYDTIDLLAAVSFVIGSVLFFFSEPLKIWGTWLFLIGSIFFLVRPLVHVLRDIHLAGLPRSGGGQGAQD